MNRIEQLKLKISEKNKADENNLIITRNKILRWEKDLIDIADRISHSLTPLTEVGINSDTKVVIKKENGFEIRGTEIKIQFKETIITSESFLFSKNLDGQFELSDNQNNKLTLTRSNNRDEADNPDWLIAIARNPLRPNDDSFILRPYNENELAIFLERCFNFD